MYVLVEFGYGNDVCGFPDGGNGVGVEREIVEICHVDESLWSKVFEVSDVDVVWAARVVDFAVFDG